MRVIPVHSKLVRVEDAIGERYAVRGCPRWAWDHTGRAVCPVVQAAIDTALRSVRVSTAPPG